MIRIDQTEESSAVVAGPIRLTFRYDGHRWSHELSAQGRPLAASFEMESGRDDPALVITPAYQHLTYQEVDRGVQALLVGQWGSNHCSGVFTVHEQDGAVSIEVDVAVRSRGGVEAAGATYLVYRTTGDLREAVPTAVSWDVDGERPALLRIEAGESGALGVAEGGRQACRVQVSRPPTLGSATQRFSYCWRWLESAATL